jgi:hypothetical protein
LRFDPAGGFFIQASEGGSEFLYHVDADGTKRRKVVTDPLIELGGVSPDGKWVIARVAVSGGEVSRVAVMAYPIGGGSPIFICENTCPAGWGPNGKFFYFWFHQMNESGTTWQAALIPLRPGSGMPRLPPSGVESPADIAGIPGIRVIHRTAPPTADPQDFAPGPDLSTYALTRTAVHRNLYRIPVR